MTRDLRGAAQPVVLSAAAGVAAALLAAGVSTSRAALLLTCGALCLPGAFSVMRLRRTRDGIVSLLLSCALIIFFVPRLLALDPSKSLIAAAALTPQEISGNLPAVERALAGFALAMTLAFALGDRLASSGPRGGWGPDGVDARAAYIRTVRLDVVLAAGVFGSMAGIVTGLIQGVGARDVQTAPGAAGVLALLSGAAPPVPAALWLAHRRAAAIAMLPLTLIGPFLIGARQDMLTPLLYLGVALVVERRAGPDTGRRLNGRWLVALALIATAAAAAAVLVTTSRRAESEAAVNGGVAPSAYSTLVENQTLLDSLLVAVAREDRPQGLRIYERALSAPVPRFFWHDKPLSYDFDFRARQFPQYGGAIPISLVGTAYLSFLLPGALVAGFALGWGAVLTDRLIAAPSARSVLLGAALALFLPDVLRVGGLYREVISFGLVAAVVVVITRPVSGDLSERSPALTTAGV